MEKTLQITQEALDYLKNKDKKMCALIEKAGVIERPGEHDVFTSLVDGIIGQQISSVAAKTVKRRFIECVGGTMTAEGILAKTDAELQACGLSWRKVSYIKGVAESAVSGAVQYDKLPGMTKEEVMAQLLPLKGVGEWTVEMILLFSLGHPDIISYKDLAILRGIALLYGHKKVTKELFKKYEKRYSPYASVASLYLWHLAGGQV